ncbi:copper amine oxidase N-terminal domain-containing protein [Peptoniphilus sp.]|jgi:hypothetical protein|uniref:copper amine oxidase N-terminal domain-containing protein n=1 Tax=Peptoniphilus sp. TaxID=1971214 RepID=UPI003D9328DD
MKKQFKKVLLLILVVLMFIPLSVFAESNIKLWINGNFVNSDVDPVILDNRTLVPVRVITENLGYKVEWNAKTQEVNIIYDEDNYFTFTIGKKGYYAGDTFNDSDIAPKIINDRTFVPLRIIAEVTGNKVDWDSNNRVAIVGEGYKPIVKNNTEKKVTTTSTVNEKTPVTGVYVGNLNSHKFHYSDCKSVKKMSDKNKVGLNSREEAINGGYTPCQICNP